MDCKPPCLIARLPWLLSAVALVLGIIAVSVANSGHRHPVRQDTKSELHLHVCVPCDKLTCAHELDLLQSLTHIGDQCCALNATQLAVLTQLIVGSRPPLTLPPFQGSSNTSPKQPTTMHMKLAPPDEESSSTEQPEFQPYKLHFAPPPPSLEPEFQPYKLHFVPEEKNLLLEHWRGVELFTDRVVITQTGHYYMYSSVAFRPDSPLKCGDFQYQTWNNSILLTRPENAAVGETLVTATHTCCDECKHNQETTYAAGVFLLQTGDSINVEVSGSRLVSYKPQSTFFGLVLLGSYRTEG